MKLNELYNDGEGLKEIREYLTEYFSKKALELVIDGDEEAMAMSTAIHFLNSAFDDLDLELRGRPKEEKKNIVNPAR